MLKPLTIFIPILLFVLLFWIKCAKKGNYHEDFLELSQAKNIQGFAAVTIILHHLTQLVTIYGAENKGFINAFNDLGIFCTGVFFFYSGYGLYTSLITKENYLDGFFRKRYSTILIPFFVINLLFCLVCLPMQEKNPVIIICNVLGAILLNSNMWYIVEIALLYLAFYIIFKNPAKQKYGLLKMAIVVVVMIVGSLLLGHDHYTPSQGIWFMGEWWYNTTALFLVGMLIAKYRQGIVGFAKKYYPVLLSVSIVLFGVLFVLRKFVGGIFGYWTEYPGHPGYLDKFVTLLAETTVVVVFVLLLLLVSMKLKFNNGILRFLGKIALELYLVHNLFIMLLGDKKLPDILLYILVYAGGVGLALFFHWIDGKLIKVIQSKK